MTQSISAQDLELLRSAAQAGQVNVQLQLGRLLKHYPELGERGEWAKWLQMAAERGSGDACWELAEVMLEHQDNKRAHAILLLGATLAHPACLREAGVFALNGTGVIAADAAQAFSLFSRGAKLGDTVAQYYLGRCHAKAIGTLVSLPLAREWFGKAAAGGELRATEALKHITLGGFKSLATLP